MFFQPFAFINQPVWNIRNDVDSGSLQIALPGTLVTQTGIGMSQYYNDISATIKGTGSNKTIVTTSISQDGTNIKFPANGYTSSISCTNQLFASDTPDFEFEGGNFTIETWVNLSNAATNFDIFWKYVGGNVAASELLFDVNGGRIRCAADGPGGSGEDFFQTDVLSWSANTWYHICLQRSGSNFRITRDGVAPGGGTATITRTLNTTATAARIMGRGGAAYSAVRIQDYRIYKGAAKYGGNNFTPPPSMLYFQ